MSLDSQTTRRASHWGFTLNNPNEEDRTLIRTQPKWLRMVKGQDEIGATGTLHIQGYANTDQIRLSALRQWLPRAHFEPLMSKQHIENMKTYVHKVDGTEVANTQFEIVIRSADNYQSLSMSSILTNMASHAWNTDDIKNVMEEKGYKKVEQVYEEEYWDIVSKILMEDDTLITLFTMPQYVKAWTKTRKVWLIKHQVDSQTEISYGQAFVTLSNV